MKGDIIRGLELYLALYAAGGFLAGLAAGWLVFA